MRPPRKRKPNTSRPRLASRPLGPRSGLAWPLGTANLGQRRVGDGGGPAWGPKAQPPLAAALASFPARGGVLGRLGSCPERRKLEPSRSADRPKGQHQGYFPEPPPGTLAHPPPKRLAGACPAVCFEPDPSIGERPGLAASRVTFFSRLFAQAPDPNHHPHGPRRRRWKAARVSTILGRSESPPLALHPSRANLNKGWGRLPNETDRLLNVPGSDQA